jgi:hypothetical protein
MLIPELFSIPKTRVDFDMHFSGNHTKKCRKCPLRFKCFTNELLPSRISIEVVRYSSYYFRAEFPYTPCKPKVSSSVDGIEIRVDKAHRSFLKKNVVMKGRLFTSYYLTIESGIFERKNGELRKSD